MNENEAIYLLPEFAVGSAGTGGRIRSSLLRGGYSGGLPGVFHSKQSREEGDGQDEHVSGRLDSQRSRPADLPVSWRSSART